MWGAHVLVVKNILFLFVDREFGLPLHIVGAPPPRGGLLRSFFLGWPVVMWGAHVLVVNNFLFLFV